MTEQPRRIVLRDNLASEWLSFSDPVDTLQAFQLQDVAPVLFEVERRVSDEGLFAAGFVCYEAASAFDSALLTHTSGPLPLLSFGLFQKPIRMKPPGSAPVNQNASIHWTMTESSDVYVRNIDAIKLQIAQGNTYQVNYTVRQEAGGINDPWSLFLEIAADAPFAAYLEYETYAIVSASPE